MLTSTLLLTGAFLSAATGSPIERRQTSSQSPVVVDATYDGSCFYPKPDDDFELDNYLGRWYQVAGTEAPFTAGCKCIYAEYSLNSNGTVDVFNSCELSGQQIRIEGTATAFDEDSGYGEQGVFQVVFPGQSAPECPGPNYIVQDIEQDDDDDDDDDEDEDDDDDDNDGSFAIVQASNFTTLFLLSREQNPPSSQIDAWLERARKLGTNMTDVVRTDQTGCQFT